MCPQTALQPCSLSDCDAPCSHAHRRCVTPACARPLSSPWHAPWSTTHTRQQLRRPAHPAHTRPQQHLAAAAAPPVATIAAAAVTVEAAKMGPIPPTPAAAAAAAAWGALHQTTAPAGRTARHRAAHHHAWRPALPAVATRTDLGAQAAGWRPSVSHARGPGWGRTRMKPRTRRMR